jgi:hypothetical protein
MKSMGLTVVLHKVALHICSVCFGVKWFPESHFSEKIFSVEINFRCLARTKNYKYFLYFNLIILI